MYVIVYKLGWLKVIFSIQRIIVYKLFIPSWSLLIIIIDYRYWSLLHHDRCSYLYEKAVAYIYIEIISKRKLYHFRRYFGHIYALPWSQVYGNGCNAIEPVNIDVMLCNRSGLYLLLFDIFYLYFKLPMFTWSLFIMYCLNTSSKPKEATGS